MAEKNPQQIVAEVPETSPEDIADQLSHSRQLVALANIKAEEAEKTVSEMSRVLRRIAAAMDRNPQSWDELFDGRQ